MTDKELEERCAKMKIWSIGDEFVYDFVNLFMTSTV